MSTEQTAEQTNASENHTDSNPNITSESVHAGSCHCGAVQFQVRLDLHNPASRCNCSICTKLGVAGALVKPDAFTLLQGRDSLLSYQWGAKISTRYFCKVCGVLAYGAGYLAEVGGEFVSVNLNCLDDIDVDQQPVIYWDGRHDNWQSGPRSTPWPRFAGHTRAAA